MSSAVVETVFLQQAQHLCQGGELLPGGVEALARRLQQAAQSQQPLNVKLGLDPTRPDLHLGHAVVLRRLRTFQDLGHRAILIIGDATAMIGDPSGRNQTRPPLSNEEVAANAQTYLDQAGKIIDVEKASIVRNSTWLHQMHLGDWLKLAANVTVAQILAREDFAKRYEAQQAIALHELFYPLMQGYDSVMVDADIELGGTDQRFNNLMGRELQGAYKPQRPAQLVLLMPLLEGTDGVVKMSKSYPEHCINLTDPPEDMYGKMMSIPDGLLSRYQQLLTPVSPDVLQEQEARVGLPKDQGGIHPRDVKAYLAKWVVGIYHGQEAATRAEQDFIQRFQQRGLPQDMPTVQRPADVPTSLVTLMVDTGLAPSRAEARRLITGGGVRLNGEEKVADPATMLTGQQGQTTVVQVGRRKYVQIVFV
jgi:tyrosyl-tRNA synthetase